MILRCALEVGHPLLLEPGQPFEDGRRQEAGQPIGDLNRQPLQPRRLVGGDRRERAVVVRRIKAAIWLTVIFGSNRAEIVDADVESDEVLRNWVRRFAG